MDPIKKLVAIEDIKSLKAKYIRYLDTKNWDGMVEIWTPDATFDVRTGGQVSGDEPSAKKDRFTEEGLCVGLENIKTMMRSIAAPPFVSVHFGHMPEIEILSETEAKAIWPLEDFGWWPGGIPYNTLHGYGHWLDTYVRLDGRWLKKTCKVTRLRVDVT